MTLKLYVPALIVVLGFFLATTPNTAHAHGLAGITFTSTTTAGYIVDVDYRDPSIEAGRIGRFDFRIFTDGTRQKEVNFTDIWVRIVEKDGSKAGNTLFAGAVAREEFGGNGFSYVFAKEGTYMLEVRYNDTSKNSIGETVGEAEFTLDVRPSSEKSFFPFGIQFWIGLLIGLLGGGATAIPYILRSKKA